MAEERINRKLAAILAADVVGYSRLMAADEAGTLAALKQHRQTVFEPAVAAHQGRIVKLIGDGTIVEFASVVDAVNCALSVQRSGELQDESQPKIILRIGINLGDVIIEGDDIYGDGVNVAVCLQSVAKPGGIVTSQSVRDQIGNRLDIAFEDYGEKKLKNIDQPVRVYGVALSGSAVDTKPSIAVLPFTNMSGDPEQEYFSDGITEDIITDLSKISGLFVVARNTAFTFKGRPINLQEAGRELEVDFLLEGSVRKVGSRVRV